MFKTYGVCYDTNGELAVMTGREKQAIDTSKDLYYDDGGLGGVLLDGADGYKLHEMEYNDDEFKDLVESFISGTFIGMNGVIAVDNEDGNVSYLGIPNMEDGYGVQFYLNQWTPGVPAKDDFLPTDASGDAGYQEHMVYTCNGQVF